MNIRHLNKSDVLVENIQIHEYLTNVPQVGRRDYRIYPPRYAYPYYIPPPPGDHRRNVIGMGRGRGRKDPTNVNPDDVHAVVQMEEAERQFNRGQVTENRER